MFRLGLAKALRLTPGLICSAGLWAGGALAQSPIAISIDTQAPSRVIPTNSSGLIFFQIDQHFMNFRSATNVSGPDTNVFVLDQLIAIHPVHAQYSRYAKPLYG
jgi:hypothetical protein